MAFLFSLLVIALMIGALIDIITRDSSLVKFLPKLAWIIIVILLPLIGGLLWFGLGREYGESRDPNAGAPAQASIKKTPPPPPNSRLSCQLKVDAAMDGLVVRVADNH